MEILKIARHFSIMAEGPVGWSRGRGLHGTSGNSHSCGGICGVTYSKNRSYTIKLGREWWGTIVKLKLDSDMLTFSEVARMQNAANTSVFGLKSVH